jgi:tripartite-type tricarboxylate transporter receptor subunit TctC
MKMNNTRTPSSTVTSTLRRRRLLAAGALASLAASVPMGEALAQGSPPAAAGARPIRLIVPYAAGGPIDVTARLLAEKVKDTLGTVIIDNKPGAGGNLGADLVAKAAPDGLTIGISAVATHAINPWLFSKMPYDADRDFAAITQMLRVPNVLVMNTDTAARLKINTLADLIAYAKANPGRLNYASGGNGSAGHLAGELLNRDAGIASVHVPFNGGNPAQLALLSGQVDFNFDNLATAAPNIRALFQTPENFMAMVRQAYPVVYRPKDVQFLTPRSLDAAVVQPVHMRDSDGKSWLAMYTLQRQADGRWLISGCVLAPNRSVGA